MLSSLLVQPDFSPPTPSGGRNWGFDPGAAGDGDRHAWTGNRGLGTRGGRRSRAHLPILCCGGPSHLDTWDLKPAAADGIRGPYRPIASSVPGDAAFLRLHPRMSTLTQHFSLIRSMTHVGNISNHFDAMHHCLSGQADSRLEADAPYIGSCLWQRFGPMSGASLPTSG